jgi:hypothetical protein
MVAPTTITVTYISTPPSTTSQVTIPIPTGSGGSVGGVAQPVVPQDFTAVMNRINANGGFWFVNSSGVQQFVPWGEIVSATAQ